MSTETIAAAGRGLRPEHELLLCCARLAMGPEHRDRLRAGIEGGLSWDRLGHDAAWHGVLPLVYRNVAGQARELAPEPVLERWRRASATVRHANLVLTSELIRLAEAFRGEGLPWAVFKGPVAAQTIYGDLGLRPFSDLDLLVPEGHLGPARALLERLGYAAYPKLRPGWDEVHRRRYTERQFRREAPVVAVDLHWGLVPPGYSFGPDVEDLCARREEVGFGAVRVPTLGPEDTLVMLGLHAAKHEWSSLHWICDLAEFVRARPGLDWDRILSWAEPRGAARQVHVGLSLAHRLLEGPVPPDVLARGGRDRAVAAIAGRAVDRVLFPEGGAPASALLPWDSLWYRAMERGHDRRRLVAEAMWWPRMADWLAVPLPVWLEPAYYAIRPLRLLWKHTLGRR